MGIENYITYLNSLSPWDNNKPVLDGSMSRIKTENYLLSIDIISRYSHYESKPIIDYCVWVTPEGKLDMWYSWTFFKTEMVKFKV